MTEEKTNTDAPFDARVKRNRETIMAALRSLGATKVRVFYCGSGDSGGIEDVEILGSDNQPLQTDSLPNVQVMGEKGIWEGEKYQSIETNEELRLDVAIKDFCYDRIGSEHAGYENNDGGEGTFLFDPESGKITWEHKDFYLAEEVTDHEV